MQDRFKFRVWDKTKEIMVYFDGIFYNKKPYTEGSSFPQYDSCPHYHKLSDLMQSTGLKAKNGKLIYEGDIVKYKDEVYDLCIGRIEWDNTHYELLYYTGEKYGWFSHILCIKHIKNIEVIGNIYENKELLDE